MKRPSIKGCDYKLSLYRNELDRYIDTLESQLAEAKEEIERRRNEFNLLTDGQSKTLDKLGEAKEENTKLKEDLKEWKELSSHLRTIYQEDSRSNQVYTQKLEALTQKKGEEK